MRHPSIGAAQAALAVVLCAGCGGSTSSSTPYQRADLVRGARLFDNWMKEKRLTLTTPNPGYALTQGKSTSVTASWRCNECHGWDYRGKDGAYATGSHFTGVIGVLDARADPPEEVFDTVRNGVEGKAMTAFGKQQFSDADIWDLAKFLREGTIDLKANTDATGNLVGGDAVAGKVLYEQGLPGTDYYQTCAYCHGTDGRRVNFHTAPQAPEYLGTVTDSPAQFVHHVRFGYAGGNVMPAHHDRGWTVKNVLDVLAYAETLPTK